MVDDYDALRSEFGTCHGSALLRRTIRATPGGSKNHGLCRVLLESGDPTVSVISRLMPLACYAVNVTRKLRNWLGIWSRFSSPSPPLVKMPQQCRSAFFCVCLGAVQQSSQSPPSIPSLPALLRSAPPSMMIMMMAKIAMGPWLHLMWRFGLKNSHRHKRDNYYMISLPDRLTCSLAGSYSACQHVQSLRKSTCLVTAQVYSLATAQEHISSQETHTLFLVTQQVNISSHSKSQHF